MSASARASTSPRVAARRAPPPRPRHQATARHVRGDLRVGDDHAGRRDLKGEHLLVVDDYHFWSRASTATSEPIDKARSRSRAILERVSAQWLPLDFRKASFSEADRRPTISILPHLPLGRDAADREVQDRGGYETCTLAASAATTSPGDQACSPCEAGRISAPGAQGPESDQRRRQLFYERRARPGRPHSTGPDVEYRPPKKTEA